VKKLIIMCLFLGLMACAPRVNIDAGLSALTGASKDEVFAALGPPNSSETIGGMETFIWSTSRLVDDMQYMPVNTTGKFGRTSYSQNMGLMVPTTRKKSCRIAVMFNAEGRAINYNVDEQTNGCRPFEEKLAKLSK